MTLREGAVLECEICHRQQSKDLTLYRADGQKGWRCARDMEHATLRPEEESKHAGENNKSRLKE